MHDRVKLVLAALLVIAGVFAWREVFSYGAPPSAERRVAPLVAQSGVTSSVADRRWTDLEASVALPSSAWGVANGVSDAECSGLGTYRLDPNGLPAYRLLRCVASDHEANVLSVAVIEVTGPDSFVISDGRPAHASSAGSPTALAAPATVRDSNGRECDASWAKQHNGRCGRSDGE
jgi:hypothetical protein